MYQNRITTFSNQNQLILSYIYMAGFYDGVAGYSPTNNGGRANQQSLHREGEREQDTAPVQVTKKKKNICGVPIVVGVAFHGFYCLRCETLIQSLPFSECGCLCESAIFFFFYGEYTMATATRPPGLERGRLEGIHTGSFVTPARARAIVQHGDIV